MGSSHFGEIGMGNGRSGSSRKGKKSNWDKPKQQPQRGLGVAQLEKIRLHNQMMAAGSLSSLDDPSISCSNPNKEEGSVKGQIIYSSSSSSSPPSSSFGLNSNFMMGFGGQESTNIRYGDLLSSTTRNNRSLLNHNSVLLPHVFEPPIVTLPLLEQEDSMQKWREKDWCNSMGSFSKNSNSSDSVELDLELRL